MLLTRNQNFSEFLLNIHETVYTSLGDWFSAKPFARFTYSSCFFVLSSFIFYVIRIPRALSTSRTNKWRSKCGNVTYYWNEYFAFRVFRLRHSVCIIFFVGIFEFDSFYSFKKLLLFISTDIIFCVAFTSHDRTIAFHTRSRIESNRSNRRAIQTHSLHRIIRSERGRAYEGSRKIYQTNIAHMTLMLRWWMKWGEYVCISWRNGKFNTIKLLSTCARDISLAECALLDMTLDSRLSLYYYRYYCRFVCRVLCMPYRGVPLCIRITLVWVFVYPSNSISDIIHSFVRVLIKCTEWNRWWKMFVQPSEICNKWRSLRNSIRKKIWL